MPIVATDSEWHFVGIVCENCGCQLVTDQLHWPVCPECSWRPLRVRIEPQPWLDSFDTWWYGETFLLVQPFFDAEQLKSHLLHNMFGNSEIDVDMYPVLDNGVWYWERETA